MTEIRNRRNGEVRSGRSDNRKRIAEVESRVVTAPPPSVRLRRTIWALAVAATGAFMAGFGWPLIQKLGEDKGVFGDPKGRSTATQAVIDVLGNPWVAWPSAFLLGLLVAFWTFRYLVENDRLQDRGRNVISSLDELESLFPEFDADLLPLLREPQDLRDVAMYDSRHPYGEAVRRIRAKLGFATPHGVPRSILVTSSIAAEGKSSFSIILAHQYARQGKNVLLVDGDMRNPALHRYFQVSMSPGLSNYLAGENDIAKMIQLTSTERLSLMPSGPIPPNPADLLDSHRPKELFEQVNSLYDLVIIDSCPVLRLADAVLWSRLCQYTIFTVCAPRTEAFRVERSTRELDVSGENLMLILNYVRPTRKDLWHYGYGY